MPTWPSPSKKTRSPGWRSLRATGLPIPYWAYELCGSEMPTWAKTYMTRPEQSKPEGEAPPQTYGVPRYRIAIPTTPPCVGGGAADTGGELELLVPGVVVTGDTALAIAWGGAACCCATCAASWRRSSAC